MKNTLIVSTSADLASENIANSLKQSYDFWKPVIPDKMVYRARSSITGGKVWLWVQESPLLHMNNVDEMFKAELASSGHVDEDSVDDVIFLSKHCAASGKASLTVHPIGIPWCADAADHGGFPGRCSPPSERIAPLYRFLLSECKRRNLNEQFEVTLEATHHGPFVSVPACFVEIGSSEAEWGIPEAGDIWAHCLADHLKLVAEDDNSSGGVAARVSEEPRKKLVMVLIGGGHYVPKMNDAVSTEMCTGHNLAC
jgi:D-aminoacyl-tRNA deacylase